MSIPVRYTVRFAVALAILAAIVLVGSPAQGPGPYLSALADGAVTSAFAVPINCPNNSCGGKKGCRADHGFYCTLSGTSCENSKCL